LTRVVLAAAHLDNDPTNNRLVNLRCLCQRCHMLHDRPFHLAQRWLTYRRRRAIGDLFFGRYGIRPPPLALFATAKGASAGHPATGWDASRIGSRAIVRDASEDLFKTRAQVVWALPSHSSFPASVA
jgi:hypothetical protein